MQILLNVNLSLNQSLLTFLLYVRQAWMTQTILEVSLWGVVFFKSKKIVAWALCLENSVGSYVLGQLHFIQWLTYSPSSSLWTVFDSISSNIDEVLSINPSANLFVFGDFHDCHKDWLNYSGGTDRPGELCFNFSISNDCTQMVNFPTWILGSDSYSPSLLDLFFLTLVCVLHCLSHHWKFLIILLSQLTLTFH